MTRLKMPVSKVSPSSASKVNCSSVFFTRFFGVGFLATVLLADLRAAAGFLPTVEGFFFPAAGFLLAVVGLVFGLFAEGRDVDVVVFLVGGIRNHPFSLIKSGPVLIQPKRLTHQNSTLIGLW